MPSLSFCPSLGICNRLNQALDSPQSGWPVVEVEPSPPGQARKDLQTQLITLVTVWSRRRPSALRVHGADFAAVRQFSTLSPSLTCTPGAGATARPAGRQLAFSSTTLRRFRMVIVRRIDSVATITLPAKAYNRCLPRYGFQLHFVTLLGVPRWWQYITPATAKLNDPRDQ